MPWRPRPQRFLPQHFLRHLGWRLRRWLDAVWARLLPGASEDLLRQRYTPWGSVLLGVLAAGLGVGYDFLFPAAPPGADPIGALQTLLGILGAATLAIFVSVALLGEVPARQRRILLDVLAEDPEREKLFHLIVFGAVVVLCQIVAANLWPGVVWRSVLIPTSVSIAVIALLFGYVRARLRLFTPRHMADYLSDRAAHHQRRALAVPPPKNEKGARRRIADQQLQVARRFCDLALLCRRELDEHEGEPAAVRESLRALFGLLAQQAKLRSQVRDDAVLTTIRVRNPKGKDLEDPDWFAVLIDDQQSNDDLTPAVPRRPLRGSYPASLWLERLATHLLPALRAKAEALPARNPRRRAFAEAWKSETGMKKWRESLLRQYVRPDNAHLSWAGDLVAARLLADLLDPAGRAKLAELAEKLCLTDKGLFRFAENESRKRFPLRPESSEDGPPGRLPAHERVLLTLGRCWPRLGTWSAARHSYLWRTRRSARRFHPVGELEDYRRQFIDDMKKP